MLSRMRSPIVEAAADVLHEQDPSVARARLAQALLAATGTELAARVSLRRDRPDARVQLYGTGPRPAPEQMPRADEIRGHPLHRYRVDTGDRAPTTLEEVDRRGWRIDARTRGVMEELRLPAHQLELVIRCGADYAGWTLIAPSPIDLRQLRPLAEHARLLRGLDAHIELLARALACAPWMPAQWLPAQWLPAQWPPAAGPLAQGQPGSWSAAADALRLTPRELTVLHLMYAGRTAGAIGARLGVSPRTVQKHQEHLYRKLGACDRLSAVLVAQRAGLLPAMLAGQEAAAAAGRARC